MGDREFMAMALREAKQALLEGEIPIGAVVVFEGTVIAVAHNEREAREDAAAHAEMLAIERAARRLGRRRLTGCTLYVTIEPCPMCAGVILNARTDRLVYGAPNEEAGCADSVYPICREGILDHRPRIRSGILKEACRKMMDDFFKEKRDRIS